MKEVPVAESESKVLVGNRYVRPIVELESRGERHGGYFVLVSHQDLDSQIGRLMQMCDLIGDTQQRAALKSTIKNICREWLDNMYSESGYDRWTGLQSDADVINH